MVIMIWGPSAKKPALLGKIFGPWMFKTWQFAFVFEDCVDSQNLGLQLLLEDFADQNVYSQVRYAATEIGTKIAIALLSDLPGKLPLIIKY